MKKRIGFEDDSVSRRGLARFLLGLRSSFSNDALSDVPDWEKDMEASEASMVSGASSLATVDKKMVGKRAHFWPQYRVLLHQNAIRWVRLWQQKTHFAGHSRCDYVRSTVYGQTRAWEHFVPLEDQPFALGSWADGRHSLLANLWG